MRERVENRRLQHAIHVERRVHLEVSDRHLRAV
jgi:hypothetical protein